MNALLTSFLCLMLASCDLRWRDIVYVLLFTVGTSKCVMTIQTLNIPLSALTDSRNTDELSSDSRCPMSETGFKIYIAEGKREGDSSEVCRAYCARKILPQPAGPAAVTLSWLETARIPQLYLLLPERPAESLVVQRLKLHCTLLPIHWRSRPFQHACCATLLTSHFLPAASSLIIASMKNSPAL